VRPNPSLGDSESALIESDKNVLICRDRFVRSSPVRDQAPGEAGGLTAKRVIEGVPVPGQRLSRRQRNETIVIPSYPLWQKQVWSQIRAATLEFAVLFDGA
jgi:hypothetical protein